MDEIRKSNFKATLNDLRDEIIDKANNSEDIFVAMFIEGRLRLKREMNQEDVKKFFASIREVYGEDTLNIESLVVFY